MDDVRSIDEFRRAAGDSMNFRLASSILDMALAAAECAAALEDDNYEGLSSVVAAKEFFTQVRKGVVFNDTGTPLRHLVMGNHGKGWDIKHPGYLKKAEECLHLLVEQGRTSRSERFKECLGRLKQKIVDGHRLEAI